MKSFPAIALLFLMALSFSLCLSPFATADGTLVNFPSESQLENADYAIHCIDVDPAERQVSVYYHAAQGATLVVEIWDTGDNTSQTSSGMWDTNGISCVSQNSENVAANEVSDSQAFTFDSLPQYFAVQVWLQDASGRLLTKEKRTVRRYTKAIQDLYAMKSSDYDSSRIIDLSKSDCTFGYLGPLMAAMSGLSEYPYEFTAQYSDDSFLVLKDDVILIRESSVLTIDPIVSSPGYILKGANNALAGLEQGKTVFLDDNGRYAAGILSAVTQTDEGIAVMLSSSDFTMQEYVSAAKIEYCARFETDINFSDPIVGFKLTAHNTGEVNFTFVDKGWGCAYIDLTVPFSLTGGKVEFSTLQVNPITFTIIPIPLVPIIPGLIGIDMDLKASIGIKAVGNFEFDMTGAQFGLEAAVTLFVDITKLDVLGKCKSPNITLNSIQLQGEVSLIFKIGPELSYGIGAVGGYFGVGPVLAGKVSGNEFTDDGKRWHACQIDKPCFGGNTHLRISLSVAASFYRVSKSFGWVYDFDPFQQFYFTLTFSPPGKFGNFPCPHYGYRLYVDVKSKDENPLKDVQISYSHVFDHYIQHSSDKTNENGRAIIYIPLVYPPEAGGDIRFGSENSVSISAVYKDPYGQEFKIVRDFVEKDIKKTVRPSIRN